MIILYVGLHEGINYINFYNLVLGFKQGRAEGQFIIVLNFPAAPGSPEKTGLEGFGPAEARFTILFLFLYLRVDPAKLQNILKKLKGVNVCNS